MADNQAQQRQRLLAAVGEVVAGAVPVFAVGEQLPHEVLDAALVAANGFVHGSLEKVDLRNVPPTKYALLPAHLANGLGPEGTEHLEDFDYRVIGMRSGAIWTPRRGSSMDAFLQGTIVQEGDGDPIYDPNGSPFYISMGNIILITALNYERFGNIKVSAVIAVGFALGLYNIHDDRDDRPYSQEWTATDQLPSEAGMIAALHFWGPVNAPKNVSACLDTIAFGGYSRVSHTHVVDSSNEGLTARQRGTIEQFWRDTPGGSDDISADLVPEILHGGVHGLTMGGAVGFLVYWVNGELAHPVMKVRNVPLGDEVKGFTIALAAYESLTSHPVISSALRIPNPVLAELRAFLRQFDARPWLSSSLKKYFSEDVPDPPSETLTRLSIMMAAMVAAAADEELLPDSFRSAYFVIKAKQKYSGAVQFWASFFTWLRDATGTLSVEGVSDYVRKSLGTEVVPAIEDAPAGEEEV